jgi:transcriptional regulator with XRE-family HTH domain
MHATETPRERLTRLMDERRGELGLTLAEVAECAGLTAEGLRNLRTGKSRTIRVKSKAGIERALRWDRGSVDAILSGGAPVSAPDPSEPTEEELASELLRRIDELQAVMDRKYGQRNRPVRDALFGGLRATVEGSSADTAER